MDDKISNKDSEMAVQSNEKTAKKKRTRRQKKSKEVKTAVKNRSSRQMASGMFKSANGSSVPDYVIGPPKSMNYPDVRCSKDINFNASLKVVKEDDVQNIIAEKYAHLYSVDSQTLNAESVSSFAPFNMFLCPGVVINETSALLDQEAENSDKLIFIVDDEITGLEHPIKECGQAISSDDVVPVSQVKEILNSVAFDSKVIEKYASDLQQTFPEYIPENSNANMSKILPRTFIKWGSFCLSDQFDIYSDEFKKIINDNGMIQISSLTLAASDTGRVNYAAMFIYPYVEHLSAAKAPEGSHEWEDYKNQPKSTENIICKSDNMLNFRIDDDTSPDECIYTFRNSLLMLDPKKDYIFKIADWRCTNNLGLPLESDLTEEEKIEYELYQNEDNPCGAFCVLQTDNPKDFVFFNRIDGSGDYVHDKTIDDPFGQQLYISKLTAKYARGDDSETVISANYILMYDQMLKNEDGSKKVWKVSVISNDYDENYGQFKLEEF